jgi:hypothetical protein
MLTIVNNVIHVDLLVQEKRSVSFMYFCTHENISDLFKSNLVPSASCSCGYKNEYSEHFLLYCNKFNLLRNNMLIELNMLDMRGLPVNIDILLFGNDVSINQYPKCDQEKNIRTCRSTQC